MKAIIKLLFVISLATNLYAINDNNISTLMAVKIEQATVLLQDKTKSTEEKSRQIFTILDEVFDYKLMSKIALGKKHRTLTDEQKDKFSVAFEKKLKSSYIDKLNLYTDEKSKIIEEKIVKKNRIILYTELVGADSNIAVNYKLYRNKNAQWLIYDLEILKISIIQTYRKQFKDYLKTNTIEQLLQTM